MMWKEGIVGIVFSMKLKEYVVTILSQYLDYFIGCGCVCVLFSVFVIMFVF